MIAIILIQSTHTSSMTLIEKSIIKCTSTNYKGEMVYQLVDSMPRYPGGHTQLIKDVIYAYHTPESDTNFLGKWTLTFTIDTFGLPKDIIVNLHDFPEMTVHEKAFADALKNTSNWYPGICDGRKVPVRITIPIRL